MNTPETLAVIDYDAIEIEARRLRARAVADGVRALRGWLAARRSARRDARRGAGLAHSA